MKQKLIGLSQRYVAALRKHLQPGHKTAAPNGTATRLGRAAVALGLETLALARIHGQALVTLKLARDKPPGWLKRAEIFFARANAPIEATHRAAQQTKVDLMRLKKSLSQCTVELAVRNQQLQAGGALQKLMKADFAESGKHHHKCLEESLQLQKLLRQLTHQTLTAQEEERTKISHELQDEIAQTLLGINVRLLALKQHDGYNSQGLKNEIASAQRLVLKSAKSVRQFARKLAPHRSVGSVPSRSPLP